MGAKEKGRAAKGQGGGGGHRKFSLGSGLSCVLGPPLEATMGTSPHPQAHTQLLEACQRDSLERTL